MIEDEDRTGHQITITDDPILLDEYAVVHPGDWVRIQDLIKSGVEVIVLATKPQNCTIVDLISEVEVMSEKLAKIEASVEPVKERITWKGGHRWMPRQKKRKP